MKKKKLKVVRKYRINFGNGSSVTFPVPNWKSWKSWVSLFNAIMSRDEIKIVRNVRYIITGIAVFALIGMHDVFQQIQFSQETTGTLIWAFVLLGMASWGFK